LILWQRRGTLGKALIVLLAVLSALTIIGFLLPEDNGRTTSPTTAPASTEPTMYVMSLDASESSTKTISVRGRTNVPDGAVVVVSASLAFRFMREDDVRASRVAGRSTTVKDGAFATTLGPFDYGDITVGLEDGLGDLEYGPITLVDTAVTVCAELQTGEDFDGVPRQPDASVRDAVGPFGEDLRSSPQAVEFGSLTSTPSYWLEVTERVQGGVPGVLNAIAEAQGSAPTRALLNGFCLS
jgi:hypothetical protein